VSYSLAVETEIVSADGTVLAVRRTGHGVPVVMVHGSAGGLDSWTASALQAAAAVGCLHDLEALAADGTDLARWAAIGIPLLVMQGELTWAPIPATVSALMDALPPTATPAVLKGQSHFATHTAPGLFASTVRPFLRAHSA
jgi:pimeloyl-ACP methyl ester carboxylesterase